MSIFSKFFMILCAGAFAFALSACPPPQDEPVGEEEVVVEEVETAPADDSGDMADDSGDMADDSGDTTDDDNSGDDSKY